MDLMRAKNRMVRRQAGATLQAMADLEQQALRRDLLQAQRDGNSSGAAVSTTSGRSQMSKQWGDRIRQLQFEIHNAAWVQEMRHEGGGVGGAGLAHNSGLAHHDAFASHHNFGGDNNFGGSSASGVGAAFSGGGGVFGGGGEELHEHYSNIAGGGGENFEVTGGEHNNFEEDTGGGDNLEVNNFGMVNNFGGGEDDQGMARAHAMRASSGLTLGGMGTTASTAGGFYTAGGRLHDLRRGGRCWYGGAWRDQ